MAGVIGEKWTLRMHINFMKERGHRITKRLIRLWSRVNPGCFHCPQPTKGRAKHVKKYTRDHGSMYNEVGQFTQHEANKLRRKQDRHEIELGLRDAELDRAEQQYCNEVYDGLMDYRVDSKGICFYPSYWDEYCELDYADGPDTCALTIVTLEDEDDIEFEMIPLTAMGEKFIRDFEMAAQIIDPQPMKWIYCTSTSGLLLTELCDEAPECEDEAV